MIHFIKGILKIKLEDIIVVETGGIGYEIFVPTNSGFHLLSEGEEATVYTKLIVREDDMSIYGFSDKSSLDLFKKLITVNGVGAKAGISILSSMDTEKLKMAIAFEDVDSLTKANGVGKKTAQRIVLDLKDKLGNIATSDSLNVAEGQSIVGGKNVKTEAIDALVALGYARGEASAAIIGIKGTDLTAEAIIKEALKTVG